MTIYNLVILLSQLWTSSLFHVWFCCFLICIQISQEASNVVWSYLIWSDLPISLRIFHVLLWSTQSNPYSWSTQLWCSQWSRCFSGTLLFFLMIQQMLAIWPLIPLSFLNPTGTAGSSQFTYCWSLAWNTTNLCQFLRHSIRSNPLNLFVTSTV